MLQVTVGNAVTGQVPDQVAELFRQAGEGFLIKEVRLDERQQARRLDPLHLEHRVPLALAQHAVLQVPEFHLPRAGDPVQRLADLLVPQAQVRDRTGEALHRPAVPVGAVNGEHAREVAADRLRHAERVEHRRTAAERGVLEGETRVVQGLLVVEPGRVADQAGHSRGLTGPCLRGPAWCRRP